VWEGGLGPDEACEDVNGTSHIEGVKKRLLRHHLPILSLSSPLPSPVWSLGATASSPSSMGHGPRMVSERWSGAGRVAPEDGELSEVRTRVGVGVLGEVAHRSTLPEAQLPRRPPSHRPT
jgi:hypothetical protein